MATNLLTKSAFDRYRRSAELKPIHPDARRYDGDSDGLTAADGLEAWQDGVAAKSSPKGPPPVVPTKPDDRRLWVVTPENVLHALENCPFGAAREARALKHSNLTGGADAYAGGELVFLAPETILLNGCSGRYRVGGEAEMKALAGAFRGSGYNVWSMGFDTDTNRPVPFGVQDPVWTP